MAKCIICDTELKFINTPLFSFKTKDGGKICTKCSTRYTSKEGMKVANLISKMKKYTTDEFLAELERIQNSDENKKRTEIKERIKKLNPKVVNKKEVNELPKILMDGETIEKINSGFLDDGKGFTGHGLILATNYRVIFIDKPTFGFGIKMEDFPYDKISSISIDTGLLKSKLKIICSGNTTKIDLIDGAKSFSEFIRLQTSKIKENPKIEKVSSNDIIEQIEKLASLKEKGIISEEEFNNKKTELLNKL